MALQQTAGVHEATVQAVARGDLDPLPRPRRRRLGSRNSKVIEEQVHPELMAAVRRLAAQRPGSRIVIESSTVVWVR